VTLSARALVEYEVLGVEVDIVVCTVVAVENDGGDSARLVFLFEINTDIPLLARC